MYEHIFRNHSKGGPNLVFWKVDHHSQTFFQLSPISKVKFGLLTRESMAQYPYPKYAPEYRLTVMSFSLAQFKMLMWDEVMWKTIFNQ